MRLFPISLGLLLLIATSSAAMAVSQKAMALRQANGLTIYNPPEKFLDGNFVADEMNPAYIFGPVKSFVASHKCPTTWLIEKGTKAPLAGNKGKSEEFTVYLEEDCPNQVVYYVFIDQSGLTPKQWIKWRQKFHGSKAESEYLSTKSRLDTACQAGCGVGAELRFIQKNGDLIDKSPEKFLLQDLKFPPIYNLIKQQKISK